MGKLNNRTINPSFLTFLRHFCRSFTVQNVISRTSPPAALRLAPTFAAASHQNAAVALRSSDTHDAPATDHALLIYGTGIKKLRKPTPINEYKLLIYGKPRHSAFPCTSQRESSEILIATAPRLEFAVSYRRETRKHFLTATRTGRAANTLRAAFSRVRKVGSPPRATSRCAAAPRHAPEFGRGTRARVRPNPSRPIRRERELSP